MKAVKNILFITTDQQRRESLPCYGLDFMQTPALDRLAREGIVFDNCHSISPVCQPARASFMIGQYPHVTGVPDNFRWFRPDTPTLAKRFAEAGWRTAAIGKMHFHPWDNPEGFEHRIIAEDKRHIFRPDHWTRHLEANGRRRYHPAEVPGYAQDLGAIVSPLPKDLHIDSFIGAQAVQWLRGVPEQDRFFAWISFNSPHDPYDPPPELAGLYREAPIPDPVGSAAELEHKPAYQREIIRVFKNNPLYLTDYGQLDHQKIRKLREHYLATVTLVDQQIARILQVLEDRQLLDSTLIVFSSDHGDHLGDHGLPFKSTFYESALMVPLIVRVPGGQKGQRNSSVVDWLDLHATFLSVAGIPVPDYAQGHDLSDLLTAPSKNRQRDAFSELLGAVMVKSGETKLVLCDDGDGELYDLKRDPDEVENHFRDPAYQRIRSELTGKIVGHLLGHSRVRSFGGGGLPADPQREACFSGIRARLEGEGYPGLP